MDQATTQTREKISVLQIFAHALTRETHVLKDHPELSWQQIYNHLQWEGEPIQLKIESERTRRTTNPETPWFWLKNPQHESREIVRTLDCKSTVSSCSFTPDGKTILASCGHVQVWDISTGELVRSINAYQPSVSPDGKRLIAMGPDKHLAVWDLETGLLQYPLEGEVESVNHTVISHDGQLVAAACGDYRVRIWDLISGKLVAVLDHNFNRVTSCAFSPVKPWLVSGSENGKLYIWNQNHQIFRKWNAHLGAGGVRCCSFSPDGKTILSSGPDVTDFSDETEDAVKIWDVESGRELLKLEGHRDRVYGCAYSPDGTQVVSVCDDKKVRLYRPGVSQFPREIIGHTHFVVSCSFSPDGKHIITGSQDNTIRIWETESKQAIPTGAHHDGRARSCTFSPDGKWIATSGDDRSVRLSDADSGVSIITIKNHAELEVEDCAFSPDGKQIVTAGWDGTLIVSDAQTGKKLRTLKGHEGSGYALDGRLIIGAVHTCDFSPRGDRIVSGGRDKTVRIWAAGSGSQLNKLEGHNVSVDDCEYSPDASKIASVGGENLHLWDAQTGQLVLKIKAASLPGSFNACSFSPDGDSIFAAKGSLAGLWNTTSGELLHVFQGHSKIHACDISPDGKWGVSASANGEVILWDINRAHATARILLPGMLHDISFHPFEPKLVCCGAGGAVYRLEVVGIHYGPIFVTGVEDQREISITCPACQEDFLVKKEALGTLVNCPNNPCAAILQISTKVIQKKPFWKR